MPRRPFTIRRGVQQVAIGTFADLYTRGVTGFDTLLMLGNNLGLLEGRQQGSDLLETLTAIATPDAVLIGQGMDPYATDNPYYMALVCCCR